VPLKNISQQLETLDEAKQDFSVRGHLRIERLLRILSRATLDSPDELLKYHETLLFLRAYPHTAAVLKLTERELSSFPKRVRELRDAGVDVVGLEHPEISGIAGIGLSDSFSYYIVNWLVHHQQGRVFLDEDWVEDENRLPSLLNKLIPLLSEDASVEANVPFKKWLCAAKPKRVNELRWLLERIASLPKSDAEKAELYNSSTLYVRWEPSYRASRTGLRLPVRRVFYHDEPLIQRKEISLSTELRKPPLRVERLSQPQGRRILDLTRESSTVRYRELYGFTHGDERRVLKVDVGRGVQLFVVGLPPEKRLPLRAYHAAMIFKNGIAVGYFEGLSFFERMESGFNLYYTFRDGETAWMYAQTLRLFQQLLGVTVFTLDPYQIGFENEEGIESGAFWFYRKLGFRSTQKLLAELTAREEKKIASKRGFRTSASTLRRLAAGYMIYDLDPHPASPWDAFQIRNIGFAVAQHMAQKFGGDIEKFRESALAYVGNALGLKTKSAADELLLPIALIPNLDKWSPAEKSQTLKVIRAKTSSDESTYLRAMQRHPRLRNAMIRLGSKH